MSGNAWTRPAVAADSDFTIDLTVTARGTGVTARHGTEDTATAAQVTARVLDVMIQPSTQPRQISALDVWTDVEANSGERLASFVDVLGGSSFRHLDGRETATFTVPVDAAAWAHVLIGRVLRPVWHDTTWSLDEEWRISGVMENRQESGALVGTITCESIRYDLGVRSGLVTRDVGFMRDTLFTEDQIDISQALDVIVEQVDLPSYFVKGAVAAGRPPVDLIVDGDTPLAVLTRVAADAAVELDVRRQSNGDYAIDLVPRRNAAAERPQFVVRQNVTGITRNLTTVRQATRVYVRSGSSRERGSLGDHAWEVMSVSGNDVTLPPGVIGFDDHMVGARLVVPDGLVFGFPSVLGSAQTVNSMAYGNGRWIALTSERYLFEFDPYNPKGATELSQIAARGTGLFHRSGQWYVMREDGGNRIWELDPDTGATTNASALPTGLNVNPTAENRSQVAVHPTNNRVYAFLNQPTAAQLWRLDPTDWGSTAAGFGNLGNMPVDTASGLRGIAFVGDVLYAIDRVNRVYRIDVSDPDNTAGGYGIVGRMRVTTLGSVEMSGDGDTVFVAFNHGLWVLDTDDPPSERGGFGPVKSTVEVTDSDTADGTVTVTDGSVFSAGDLVTFVGDTSASDTPFMEHKAAVDAYGVISVTIDRPDIASSSNDLLNGALESWIGGDLSAWRKLGSPTVTRVTGAQNDIGRASAHVDAPAVGDGIEQEAFSEPTPDSPRMIALGRVLVLGGQCRMSLIADDTEVAAIDLEGESDSQTVVLAPPVDYDGRQIFAVRFAAAQVNSVFVVQGAALLNTSNPPRTFIQGRIGNRLWPIATDYLAQFNGPLEELAAGIIDRRRVDPVNVEFGDVELGANARLTDPGLGLDVLRRIVAVTRDYVNPGNTSVQLASQRQTLVGVIGRRSRPEWSFLEPDIYVTEISNAITRAFRVLKPRNQIVIAGNAIEPVQVEFAGVRAGGTVTTTLASNPTLAGVTIDADHVISGTVPDTQAADAYTLTVDANDGLADAEVDFSIEVLPLPPPPPPPPTPPQPISSLLSVSASDVTVAEGTVRFFAIHASNGTGAVHLSVEGLPGFVSGERSTSADGSATLVFAMFPTSAQVGSYLVVVTATDDITSVSTTFTITVTFTTP